MRLGVAIPDEILRGAFELRGAAARLDALLRVGLIETGRVGSNIRSQRSASKPELLSAIDEPLAIRPRTAANHRPALLSFVIVLPLYPVLPSPPSERGVGVS